MMQDILFFVLQRSGQPLRGCGSAVPGISGGRVWSLSAMGCCFRNVLGGHRSVLCPVWRPDPASHIADGETRFKFWSGKPNHLV